MKSINETYREIDRGLMIQRGKYLDGNEFLDWFKQSIIDFENFVELLQLCANDLIQAFGEHGVAGKPIEIKNSVDRFIQLCKELINWEFELNSLEVPDDLKIVKTKLKGATKLLVINELNNLQKELQRVSDEKSTEVKLTFTPKMPDTFSSIPKDFESHFDV